MKIFNIKTGLVMIACFALGCHNATESDVSDNDSLQNSQQQALMDAGKTQANLKQKLSGIWTDGNTQNASFNFKGDSVLYVEDRKNYKYALTNDSITIYYPDYTYRAKLAFVNDTMLMISQGADTAKFWKFNN
ncbi:hypothetical protein [Mucilaginibacter segetis]|uniref:Lipocalin-like protein n=1 Tax=Mucilaginibacter segetis TaxID=2793071 RepID=A0A934PTB0_9SPHI|nr:hypothetical protein [Mucilaginibacter segetis]MBK0380433.1 hypothetical protein [Mucilaginibacter segetis]